VPGVLCEGEVEEKEGLKLKLIKLTFKFKIFILLCMVKKAALLGQGKLSAKAEFILTQLEEGKKIKEIAKILGCTVQNVYNYIRVSGQYVKKGVSAQHAVIVAKKHIDFADQLLKVAREADILLESLKLKEDDKSQDRLVRVLGEIRNQVTIWHNIRKDLFSMQQVSEAFNEIIEVIGELAPDARAKIVKRLRQKGLSDGLVQ